MEILYTLRRQFEAADHHVKRVFSHYRYDPDMDGCPCCIHENMKRQFREGMLGHYVYSAMCTWGDESDFKFYLPALLWSAYVDKEVDSDMLMIKIEHVSQEGRGWTEEEKEALTAWFSCYAVYEAMRNLEDFLVHARVEVREWLHSQQGYIFWLLELSDFWSCELASFLPFLKPDVLPKIRKLFETWPADRVDFIVLAFGMDSSLSTYKDTFCTFFGRDHILAWLLRCKREFKSLALGTADERLQAQFANAIAEVELLESSLQ